MEVSMPRFYPSERKNNMEKITFEEAMKQLEIIVKELENGNLPLERSMTAYAEGVKLAKICHDLLKNAESLIVKMEKDGNWVDLPKTSE
jgi:exodeoxyribonuclease VII small subunit